MRRPDTEIDAEADRLDAAAAAAVHPEEYQPVDLAARVLRQRMTPGQVQTAWGPSEDRELFQRAMAAANWAYGLADTRPSEALA